MSKVALSIGTNCGSRVKNIEAMESALASVLQSPLKLSSLMETSAVDVQDMQTPYLNRIISGVFNGSPCELLVRCEGIEKSLGRRHKGQKKPRTADIDILICDEVIISSDKLTIPHPALLGRRFCLEGLNQICPDWIIPMTGKTVRENFLQIDSVVKKQDIIFLTETTAVN